MKETNRYMDSREMAASFETLFIAVIVILNFFVICFGEKGIKSGLNFIVICFGEKGVKLVPASGAPAILQKANNIK